MTDLPDFDALQREENHRAVQEHRFPIRVVERFRGALSAVGYAVWDYKRTKNATHYYGRIAREKAVSSYRRNLKLIREMGGNWQAFARKDYER